MQKIKAYNVQTLESFMSQLRLAHEVRLLIYGSHSSTGSFSFASEPNANTYAYAPP
jgi:hypothetical protein